MVRLRIDCGRHEYYCFMLYCCKFAKNDLKEYIASFKRLKRNRTHTSKKTLYFQLPIGETEIEYKGNKIVVEVVEDDREPLVVDQGDTCYHRYMYITYDSPSGNSEEEKIFLTQFHEDLYKMYQKDILEIKPDRDKLDVFVWDDNYWDQSHKWTKRSMESISLGGLEKEIFDDMSKFLSEDSEKLYKRLGVPYKRNYLCYGAPGTGKTSLVNALASELNYNIATIHFDQKLTDLNFLRAIQTIPEKCILLLEDIDHLFMERKKNDDMKNAISFSGILQVLDGFASQYQLITIITTNFIEVLDKALIRRGRIDKMIEFKTANKDQIKHMYNRFVPDKMDQFNDFYKSIKNIKLTTSILQDYLFKYMDCENILEFVDELEKTVIDTSYKENSDLYS